MKSTPQNPVAFFEYIINENNIKKELDKRLEYSDFVQYTIYLPTEIKYVEQIENGEYVHGETYIKDQIIPLLRIEFERSKDIIYNSYLNKTETQNKNYLNIIFNTLQSLINKKAEIINSYPYLILPIRGIINFINDKLILSDMPSFELNEDKIDIIPDNDVFIPKKSKEGTVYSVLSYMKGKNEKHDIILSNEEYNLLIVYTLYLVQEEELPEITQQLEPKLSNDTIRFTFWVLHHELYTTKKIKNYFYDFIKAVFVKFENNEIDSIKKQFGTRSRVSKDKFLPEIITKHL